MDYAFYFSEDEAGGNLPHVLLCSHIFCSTCLRALESPQKVITCPECQVVYNDEEKRAGENYIVSE